MRREASILQKGPSAYRWVILTITTLAQTTIAVVTQGVATLAPFFRNEFSLNNAQVGFLSTIINLGNMITLILAGKATDRFGERLVLTIGAMVTGLLIMVLPLVGSYKAALFFLLLTGFWSGAVVPSGTKAVISWFSERTRGLAMGIRQIGIPLGGTIAALILPTLAIAIGWRKAIILPALLAILGGVACYIWYKDAPEKEKALTQREKPPIPFQKIISNRDILLISLVSIILIAGQYSMVTYLQIYLQETFGLPLIIGSKFLVIAQIGGVSARVITGMISDMLFGKRKTVLQYLTALAACSSAFLSFLSVKSSLFIIGLVVILSGMSLAGWNGLYNTYLAESVDKESAGTAVAVGVTLTQIGAVLGPMLFGHTVDVFHSYRIAFRALAIVLSLSTFILIFVREKQESSAYETSGKQQKIILHKSSL
ncbi:MAG: MFS transporter [Firmicutes bacterium]|nr:MFS transporter [Bacillota bacterium]